MAAEKKTTKKVAEKKPTQKVERVVKSKSLADQEKKLCLVVPKGATEIDYIYKAGKDYARTYMPVEDAICFFENNTCEYVEDAPDNHCGLIGNRYFEVEYR